ncbi:MAG: hypothetical protein DSY87_06495 [Methylococcus sp.]|nr:MAG: hypothetical protein DSY87_06495 [Methylococcus sp.]
MTADPNEIETTLHQLVTEHRDLDHVITELAERRASNQLSLRRLKKRKLLLKDRIERLSSLLIPNLDA